MARAMKDSGIEWIGEIPEGWQVPRIKNIIQQTKNGIKIGPFGSALTNKTTEKGEYNVYSQANLIASDFSFTKNTIDAYTFEELKGYEVFPGDICLSMMGTIGKCKKVPVGIVRGIMDSHLIKIRLSESVDSRFFEYVYDKDLGGVCFSQMQFDKKGFIMDGLNTSIVKNLFFPLPSKYEQVRIADFLDSECARIDAVIEQTRASIEEYRKLKQSVITQAVTKGIRQGRKMKDSGVEWIGEIPENFTRRKLKTFSEIISKGTTPKEMETEFNDIYTVRYIKSENIVANRLQELPLFTITEQIHFGELQRSKLSDRDILFVIAGASIGKVAIMRKDMLPANTNQATCFIRINTQYLKYQKYIWYVLQADFIKTYIQLFAVQSAQPNLSMADLGDLFIPVPSEEDEVYHITEYLDSMCAHIDYLTNQKEQLLLDLESYKKSLIFEYVTGKKEVGQ